MKKLSIFLAFLIFAIASFATEDKNQPVLLPSLVSYLQNAEKNFTAIPADRKLELQKVAQYIKSSLKKDKKANLIFICTHNSRRSHMSQLWAYAAASYYGIKSVENYSGGLEVTAFNQRSVTALTKAGFEITKQSEGTNPQYAVIYAKDAPAVMAFSKKYMDAPNPAKKFAAIMTCSHADESCPIVPGAAARISIPYEDPKVSDGTPNESAVYDERAKQIATEILYAFSLVKK